MTDHSYHTCPIFFLGGGGVVIKRKEFSFSGLSPEFLSNSRSTRTYTVSQFFINFKIVRSLKVRIVTELTKAPNFAQR